MKEKEKKYGLLKAVGIVIIIAIILSWLIPLGQFSSTGFTSNGTLTRVGITDIPWLLYYGVSFNIDRIVFLFVVAGLYGVLSKTEGYQRLTTTIANKMNKYVAVILFSSLVAVFTSVLSQHFVVILFIPFMVSILNRMKLDKLSVLATTFGSMIVGLMGATIGTEGAVGLNTYLKVGMDASLLTRFGILLIGLVLFNFFTIMRIKKEGEVKSINEDIFDGVSKSENKKEGKKIVWPIIVVGILIFVLVVLGFFDWNTFGITIFDDFHETVMDITLGKDFAIFSNILGADMKAFGHWDLFTINAFVILFTIVLALCYRVKFNEFVSNFANGMKKFIKPVLVLFGAYVLLTIVYMSPYVVTIMGKILSITEGFNMITMVLASLVGSIFYADLGIIGWFSSSFLTVEYVDYIKPVFIILTSIHGLVQFFIPTSVILGIGLTSLDVKYSEWLKHIWKFVLGMFVCLLVIFLLITLL